MLHKKAKWGKHQDVKLYGGVLHSGSKRLLALQGTIPGLVHPKLEYAAVLWLWLFCNVANKVSRLVLWEVAWS